MRHPLLTVSFAVVFVLTGLALAGCGGGGGGSSFGGGTPTPVPTASSAPVFTSGLVATVNDGGSGTVYTAAASASAGFTPSFSITGTDAGKFDINSATGALTFKTPPSFAAPGDADGDNEYVINVTATTAPLSSQITVAIEVAPVVAGGHAYSWSNAPWGGGGYVSGMVYHPTTANLLYARTDVGGAYRFDTTTKTWIPLNDDLGRDDSQLTGILSIALDAHDSNKLYLAAGQYLPSWGRTAAILRSNDRGTTWSRTELPIRLGGNSDGRGTGERLAVDPNKGSILFLGTSQDGLWKSSDSGITWAQVAGFGASASTFVLFDPSSATAGTATKDIYVGVPTTSGTSLYRSKDAGATWAAVPGEPAGLMPLQGALDAASHLFLTYADALGPNGLSTGAVWRLNTSSDAWTDVTPLAPSGGLPFGYSGVSVDVQHPGTLVVSTLDRWNTGDDIYRSTDNGATWIPMLAHSTHAAANYPWLLPYYGTALNNKMGHWISDVEIDPFNSDNVIYNTGYGVWMSNNLTASTVAWDFADKGLEETVVTDVLSTKAGAHLLMTQGDVAGGRYTSLSASDVQGFFSEPSRTNNAIEAAELNPNIVVRLTDASFGGYISSDNGVTWTHFAASPVTGSNGPGRAAVTASGTSLVWVPDHQTAYYSSNSGATWTASTGYPTPPPDQYFAPVADRAVDGYVYAYDYVAGAIYESADSGHSFTSALSGLPQWKGDKLLSVPGVKRRDLWVATTDGLYHVDGVGTAAAKLPSVQEAYNVSYGAPAPGQTYYALYLWGKVGGVVGIFRSDDKGLTWVRINDDAHQFGWINDLSGDPRVYGRVYLATGGRGAIIGNR